MDEERAARRRADGHDVRVRKFRPCEEQVVHRRRRSSGVDVHCPNTAVHVQFCGRGSRDAYSNVPTRHGNRSRERIEFGYDVVPRSRRKRGPGVRQRSPRRRGESDSPSDEYRGRKDSQSNLRPFRKIFYGFFHARGRLGTNSCSNSRIRLRSGTWWSNSRSLTTNPPRSRPGVRRISANSPFIGN